MSLHNCKLCGSEPAAYQTNVSIMGCTAPLWVVECTFEDGQRSDLPPYAEHTLVVYGSTEEEAKQRWQELNSD